MRRTALLRALAYGAAGVLLLLLYVAWVLQPPPSRPLPAPGALLQGVQLVVPGEGRSEPVNVEVRDGQIVSISSSDLDVPVAYVIPGLADMHMHGPSFSLPGHDRLFAFLHLYHGVTHGRLAAGGEEMRAAIIGQEYPGPALKSCGPFVDGENPQWPGSELVIEAIDAAPVVERIAEAGYDCIKVYNELTAEASRAIYESAQRFDLPVIGHVPWQQDLLSTYIDDIQHTLGWNWPYAGQGDDPQVKRLLALSNLDTERVQQMALGLVSRQVSLTPTLVTLQRKYALGQAEVELANRIELMPAMYGEHLWDPERGLVSSRIMEPAEHDQFLALWPGVLQAFAYLYRQGVEIHSGTDSPAERIVPGAGLHEELRFMTEAGLTPEQVLEISSVTSARYLRGDQYGRLSLGAPAEMLIFSQDPTLDLAHLDTLEAVIRDGRLYDRAWLDSEMAALQNWFGAGQYEWLTGQLVGVVLGVINWLAN